MTLVYVVPTDRLARDPANVEEVHQEALARLNAAYESLPGPKPELPWAEADRRLDEALDANDRDGSLAAIRAWQNWHLSLFEEFTP